MENGTLSAKALTFKEIEEIN